MANWRSRLTSIGFGALGVLLALLVYHVYTDHVAFHVIVDFLNQHGEKIRALPASGAVR